MLTELWWLQAQGWEFGGSRWKVDGKSLKSQSKVSLEVNKTQVLMKLSTKREVPDGVTSKLKHILDKGLS